MTVVDVYLNELSDGERKELERIRLIVRKFYPEARESISFGMPAFKYNGKFLVAYWAFKGYLSIFPGARTVEVLLPKLADYNTTKEAVRFTLHKPLPEPLIAEMLQLRVSDILKS